MGERGGVRGFLRWGCGGGAARPTAATEDCRRHTSTSLVRAEKGEEEAAPATETRLCPLVLFFFLEFFCVFLEMIDEGTAGDGSTGKEEEGPPTLHEPARLSTDENEPAEEKDMARRCCCWSFRRSRSAISCVHHHWSNPR